MCIEYGEWLHGRRFTLKLEGAIYCSYVRPAILYGSEAWCLKESEMGILQRTERSMVRAMCGVQLIDRKRSTDVMFMLGLNETMDQLAMANSVRWYGHVLRREDGHVLRKEDGHVLRRGWSCVEERGWSCVEERGWSCVEERMVMC